MNESISRAQACGAALTEAGPDLCFQENKISHQIIFEQIDWSEQFDVKFEELSCIISVNIFQCYVIFWVN